MDFEPQKFYIGITDFFSVILPGAILTAVLGAMWTDFKLEDTVWALFFLSSYLLGHFLFLIGSLLDDFAYNPIRKMTDKQQISLIIEGKSLAPRFLRWIANKLFKDRPDAAVTRVEQIKNKYLEKVGDSTSVNAFQWSKARLALEHPDALAVVNRFEADSKFFRSFVFVIVVLLLITLYQSIISIQTERTKWVWSSIGLAISLGLAFWRYMEQRFKATQQAYWFILTLEADNRARILDPKPHIGPDQTEIRKDGVTHAGGVIVRQCEGIRQYLLVRAKNSQSEWVLPKGHVEEDEHLKHCAIREVREETGVWASITHDLDVVQFSVRGKSTKVHFYLMKSIEEGKPDELSRDPSWFPFDGTNGALNLATYDESKSMLRLAEEKLKK